MVQFYEIHSSSAQLQADCNYNESRPACEAGRQLADLQGKNSEA
jgi:hypothetical protein